MSSRTRQFMLNLAYGAIRFALCGIFFYAGIVKLQSPQNFAIIINEFHLIPPFAVMPVAIFLPLVEVLAAIGLFFDVRGALGSIVFLLLIFIVILSYALWLGLDVDCGCFGPEDPEFYAYEGLRRSLYRDLFMLAGAVFLYVFRRLNSVVVPRLGDMLKTRVGAD